MTLLVVSVAGAVGAVARYLVSGWTQEKTSSDQPLGAMVVNVIGALGLGLMAGAGSVDSVAFAAGAGFFGGFTTFSTWMVETIRLGLRSRGALLNLVVSIAGGILAAVVGYILTAWITWRAKTPRCRSGSTGPRRNSLTLAARNVVD